MLSRRSFVHGGAAASALALTAGCSSALPPEALAAWRGPSEEDAALDPRRWMLGYAVLAPSSHNLQSWRVDLRQPGEIMLHCDLARLLPQTDPQARQIMMSQGTFLELLDLAARERGWRAEIELFPQGEFADVRPDVRPVARIRLARDPSVRPDPLFAQILKRRTHRGAYSPQEPPAQQLYAIAAALSPHPIRSGFATASQGESMQALRAIASEAWRIEMTTPRTVLESYKVLRIGPREIATHRDGISINSPMVRAIAALGLFDRSKAPAAGDRVIQRQIDDFDAVLAATPAFFWMITEGNDRRTQVQAGRAYVRAQLAAAAQGLYLHPLSQALQEYPEQAGPYRRVHELLQAPAPRHTVQMLARLGRAAEVEPAPRRGVDAIVIPG